MKIITIKNPDSKTEDFVAALLKQVAITESTYCFIKEPHFVSEERNFRQCDWVNSVTRHVNYSLSNHNTNVHFFDIQNNIIHKKNKK